VSKHAKELESSFDSVWKACPNPLDHPIFSNLSLAHLETVLEDESGDEVLSLGLIEAFNATSLDEIIRRMSVDQVYSTYDLIKVDCTLDSTTNEFCEAVIERKDIDTLDDWCDECGMRKVEVALESKKRTEEKLGRKLDMSKIDSVNSEAKAQQLLDHCEKKATKKTEATSSSSDSLYLTSFLPTVVSMMFVVFSL
jgi:hypothetical protein